MRKTLSQGLMVRMPRVHRMAATAMHPTHRGRRIAAIARSVRYEIRTGRMGKPTALPVGDRSRLLAYPGEANPVHAVLRNPPNWPEMLVWRRYLRPGDLFVDVGANIGAYTIYALECGARVVAVEPNKRNAGRIREHLQLNSYTADVLVKALSDVPGVVHMTTDLDVLNHIVDPAEGGTEVEATTLDRLLGDGEAGVKIDVEGAELLVLQGARRALREQRISLLQLEWLVADHMGAVDRTEVRRILEDAGYALCVADTYGALHPVQGEPSTMNVFAVPSRALTSLG